MAKKKTTTVQEQTQTTTDAGSTPVGTTATKRSSSRNKVEKIAEVTAQPAAQPNLQPNMAEAARLYTAVTPATKSAAPPPERESSGPVVVHIQSAEKQGDQLRATICYRGPLAATDRVLARVGVECAGMPRWQDVRDVEMRRVKDGQFEADVTLPRKNAVGADVMALQLAFQAPHQQKWDSGGSNYGYYQVSALNGVVETVQN